MYILLRSEVLDSLEKAREIEEKSDFKLETDLSKATKRDDVIAYEMSVGVENVNCKEAFDVEDENIYTTYMENVEQMTKSFLEVFPKYTISYAGAYKWDEVENRIHVVVVFSNIDLTKRKLELDILKRLLKNID